MGCTRRVRAHVERGHELEGVGYEDDGIFGGGEDDGEPNIPSTKHHMVKWQEAPAVCSASAREQSVNGLRV